MSADSRSNAQRYDRINELNQSALDLHMIDPARSRDLAEQALALVALTERDGALYEQGQAESQALLSIYYFNVTQFSDVLRLGNPVLSVLRGFRASRFLLPLLGIIGATLARIGEYSEATTHFCEMLAISIAQKDIAHEARAHVGMCMVYGETGRTKESMEASYLALKGYKSLGDIERQALVYNNISYGYIHNEQYEEAVEAALTGLALCETLEQQPHKGKLLNNIGFAYHELGAYEKSLEYLNKAFAYGEQKGDIFLTSNISHSIALTHLDRDQADLALPLLLRAEKDAQAGDMTVMLSKVQRQLSRAYRMLGNHEQALVHHEQFFELHSASFNDSNANKLAVLEVKYQTEAAKRNAELMQEMNLELEQRVAERTEALQHALERELSLTEQLTTALAAEEQLSKLRAQVITVVSHEFRTPLTVINMATDLLALKSDRMTDERKDRQHHKIRDSLGYLKGLLDDTILLDTANSAEFFIDPSRIPCLQLFTHIRQLTETQFPDSSFSYKWPAECAFDVDTDFSRLSIVLNKLIDNAASYSDTGSPIVLTATLAQGYLSIAIADKGIGFSAADAPHLFEPFFRGGNISTRRGIGLGLHIANSIAKALGGAISAESPGIDRGSTFSVRIPLQGDASRQSLTEA